MTLTPTEVAQLYNDQSDTDVSTTTVPLPTGVSAAATSPTNIAVTFTDAATNETAYELYRSRSNTPTNLTLVRTWQKDPADPTQS